MTSEQELDRGAKDFMTFPPKKFQNDKQNKDRHNFEGLSRSRREVQEGHSCS